MAQLGSDLPIWSENDFLAYVLMYAAYADKKLAYEEYMAISDIVGSQQAKKAKDLIERLDSEQQDALLLRCKDRFLKTEAELTALFEKIQRIFDADGRFCILEKSAKMYLEKILRKKV